MSTTYIVIILLCRVVQALFSKRSSMEIQGIPQLIRYTSFSKLISTLLGVLTLALGGAALVVDWKTVVIASFSGLSLFGATFCSVYGMKTGSVSAVSMFGTAGMLIPLIAGIVLFDQPILPLQWGGIALFFLSAFLLVGAARKINRDFSFQTVLLLIGSLVANGSTMLAQQLFTHYVPQGNVSVFSVISFGIVAVLGGIVSWVLSARQRRSQTPPQPMTRALVVCAVALATAVFVINQLATLSTALVPPVVLFTFINGGGTIISTVVAAIVYKEKLTVRTVCGVVLGITSLVIIKL